MDIYKPAEPCALTGTKLTAAMDKAVRERLSPDGRSLDLKGFCVGPNGIGVLVTDERLSKVKRLNLGGNRIGDEGARMLAESVTFSKVQWFELGGNDLGEEGIQALCHATTAFPKLKTLNLYRNSLKDGGAKVFAQDNELEGLEEIDLAQNEIGDEGILALANSKKFPHLAAMYLDNNFASIEAREEAKHGVNFKRLQSLNL